jgi:hypothetical protein
MWAASESIAGMTLVTNVLWLLCGCIVLLYAIVCEYLDLVGRLEIVQIKWPKIYGAMSNRPMRLALIIFGLLLICKDVSERMRVQTPTLSISFPAPPPPVMPLTPPEHLHLVSRDVHSGLGAEGISTNQVGTGNTANPGVNTAQVHIEPCGIFQNGGSGNSASTTCGPKIPKVMGFGVLQPTDPEYKTFSGVKDKNLITQVKFYGDAAWGDPKFTIYCDRPCKPIYVEPLHPDQIIYPGFTAYKLPSSPDVVVFRIEHTSFSSDKYFQVAVQSEDGSPVKVSKIEPYTQELPAQ